MGATATTSSQASKRRKVNSRHRASAHKAFMENGADSSTTRLDSYFNVPSTPEDATLTTGGANNRKVREEHANTMGGRRVKRVGVVGYAAIFGLVLILATSFLALQFYLPLATECDRSSPFLFQTQVCYNKSVPSRELLPNGDWAYNFVVVTDLDHHSRVGDSTVHHWHSFLKRGRLIVNKDENNPVTAARVEWEPDELGTELTSQIAAGGRGMELSDLVVFDGKLLTVDDRTGIIYRIVDMHRAVPWVMLNDGPGDTAKGMKAEWMSVKGEKLYVGGLGKEWTTTSGEFVNYHPMWVKVVSRTGEVHHLNWTDNYIRLREAVGIRTPGYMIHESAQWSDVHRKWVFLPRRASDERYDEAKDELRGANLMLIADPTFSRPIETRKIGSKGDGSRGFSAFQFLPHSNDEIIVALKSQEKDGVAVASYLLVFNANTAEIFLDEHLMPGAFKFEGLAFI